MALHLSQITHTAAQRAGVIFIAFILTACAQPPPPKPNDVCSIFEDRRTWLAAALATEQRWGIPASVTMAFIYQESSFIHDARPPYKKEKIMGFIPTWERITTAYGYAQATDPTWGDYKREVNRLFASRTNFRDAIDFIGWYNNKNARTLKISPHDAYNLYLAYHDGPTGYRRGDYKQDPALKQIARRVEQRKLKYARQIKRCSDRLPSTWYIPDIYT